MANKTNNYKFPKPEADDFYDISEYNKAMDILDDSLSEMDKKKLDRNGDASEAVTEFEQEILRENIESGETLSSTFAKVKKWFAEMKDVAFSGHAKDVTTDAAHRFVSDTEKSNWNGKVAATGGDISETNIDSLESISTEFPVPNQGETTKIFLGKVKKFIQDFNNFKSGIITVGKLVNSGNTTLEGYALDARYGKTLFDLYTKLNSDLALQVLNPRSILTLQNGFTYWQDTTFGIISRCGKNVHINMLLKGNAGKPYSSICSLPFTPAMAELHTCTLIDGSYVEFRTYSDGTLFLQSSTIPTINWWPIDITYTCQ
ncbi:hypothetical protein [Lacrimispora algidixylanolytica]|uniref:Uncharacterized protein n=1 Tax=Lacrimispora algidixylanolytica TaxID=94868 RepID=A0A419T3Y0_9FIRM|nr:hypothetical protein [Lacrimispora algidixylanolytica]RKD32155.1 hypothetical protein BET01_17860 [Lacrimispora algidixylanolytica]